MINYTRKIATRHLCLPVIACGIALALMLETGCNFFSRDVDKARGELVRKILENPYSIDSIIASDPLAYPLRTGLPSSSRFATLSKYIRKHYTGVNYSLNEVIRIVRDVEGSNESDSVSMITSYNNGNCGLLFFYKKERGVWGLDRINILNDIKEDDM